jgi:hypothetical protein
LDTNSSNKIYYLKLIIFLHEIKKLNSNQTVIESNFEFHKLTLISKLFYISFYDIIIYESTQNLYIKVYNM